MMMLWMRVSIGLVHQINFRKFDLFGINFYGLFVIYFSLKIVPNESKEERDYRKLREALNQWNCDFWSAHNRLFEIRKEIFYNEVFLSTILEFI